MLRRMVASLALLVAVTPAMADDFGFGFSFDSGPRYFDRGFVDSYACSTVYAAPAYYSACSTPVFVNTCPPPVVVNPCPPVVYNPCGPVIQRRAYYQRTVVAPRPVYTRPIYTAPVYRGGYGIRGAGFYNRGGCRPDGRSFGGGFYYRGR